jgi:hypothetical protein
MKNVMMLRRVTLVRTDVSEQRIASIIRVTRIGELETTLAVTSNRRALRRSTMLPLLLRKSGRAGNRTWDLCVCSQEL